MKYIGQTSFTRTKSERNFEIRDVDQFGNTLFLKSTVEFSRVVGLWSMGYDSTETQRL
jgi:hypothetical protein